MRARIPSWFDLRAGIVGSLIMGSMVAAINFSHGPTAAAISAGKQAVYTFFFGGLIMQFCAWLAARGGARFRVVGVAIVVPSIITIVLIYLVHSLRGTPEPLLSTVPVAIASPLGFTFWSRRVRREGATPWDSLRSSGDSAAAAVAREDHRR